MAHRPEIQAIVAPLGDAAWTLAALSAAVETGLIAALDAPASIAALSQRTAVPPAMVVRLLDVLEGLGLVAVDEDRATPSDALRGLARDRDQHVVLRDELRRSLGQPRCFVEDARAGRLGTAWHHTDEELIEVQGTFARVHTRILMSEGIVPTLPGLSERLARPGARALDVGAGACGNAIAFCDAWPTLHVTGLEPWPPSLALGRENVAAAGLDARIELRPDRVEDLGDADAFDFVWLPQMFLDETTLRSALARCRAALRPGGWLLTAWICDERAPGLRAALGRLRDVAFGGEARGPERLEALLSSLGFAEIRRMPFADGSLGMIGAR